MTKDSIQQFSVELSRAYPNVVLEHATGIGKSLSAIKIMEDCGGNWNIVVAELNHIQNWKKEFLAFGKEHLLPKARFFCYNSLKKYTDSPDNFIFDEAHHVFSEKRKKLLLSLNKNKKIFLSATLSDEQKKFLTSSFLSIVFFEVSLDDAIKNKILPKPVINLVRCDLDNTNKYLKYNFAKDRSVICTEKEYYNYISNRIENLKAKYDLTFKGFDKIRWLHAANLRKTFLANCKTRHAQKLLTQLEGKRLICFTNNIKQSEEISSEQNIHSNLHPNVVASRIENFNSGIADKLVVVDMLKEGQNLTNIEVGVIIQLDNKKRTYVQMQGRVLRSKFPITYILFMAGTNEESYIFESLSGIDLTYINVIRL